MADDWQDIGSGIEIFPIDPNWISSPETNVLVARDIRRYPGTATEVDVLQEKTPFQVTCQFLLDTDADNYDFIDFFATHYARVHRFWFKHPKRSFTLKKNSNAGGGSIYAYPNFANLVFQGYERIYIRFKSSGDYMSRKVVSALYNDLNDEVELVLDTVLDRQVTVGDVAEFGRLLLGRYDIDTLTIKYQSNGVGVGQIKFYELVEEYSEI